MHVVRSVCPTAVVRNLSNFESVLQMMANALTAEIREQIVVTNSDVQKYFSRQEWREMSDYEKVQCRNVLRNHLVMNACGIKTPLPAFLANYEANKNSQLEVSSTSKRNADQLRNKTCSSDSPASQQKKKLRKDYGVLKNYETRSRSKAREAKKNK